MNPKEILRKYYKDFPRYPIEKTDVTALAGYGDKLGEIIMLSRIPLKSRAEKKNIYTFINPENKFRDIFYKYVLAHLEPPDYAKRSAFQPIVENRNCGPGQILQQVYGAIGLSIDIKPRGFLGIPSQPKKNKVGIHIDGVGAGTLPGCPYLRTIYPHNVQILQEFIKKKTNYEFVQFGLKNPLDGVTSFIGKSLEDSIQEVATCEFMICINSAFMHIAAALDVKIICIINNPRIERCYFPVMVNDIPPCVLPYQNYDQFWLYPQAVFLHQDGSNELVPRFSQSALDMALRSMLYPYWSDDYLDLITEYDFPSKQNNFV